MKKIALYTIGLAMAATTLLLSSCDDFLGIMPKGKKVPATLADYEAFIRNEDAHVNDAAQAIYLMNDRYLSPSYLREEPSFNAINYNWQENEDRTKHNKAVEWAYSCGYKAIFYWNLIVVNAPTATECSEAAKQELIAQAKVLRAMNYFQLTGYYAAQYDPATAATSLSVPLITSPDMGAPSVQVSIAEMYEFMLKDLTEALPYLPKESATALHPNTGCGHAMLARVYLSMGDYDNALASAEKALQQNSRLFDWRQYYEQNKAQIDNPNDYSTTYPTVTMSNPENYLFRYGTLIQRNGGLGGLNGAIPLNRGKQFEVGDARFLCKWKYKYEASDSIYTGISRDKFNGGGITTPEMYYIKAECLARKGGQGNLNEAMNALNAVRVMRILAESYTPRTATTVEQAIAYIRQEKNNEYVQTAIPFWDARRFNKNSKYAITYTKTVNGVPVSLTPQSHLWIMPFSQDVMNNPGNGTITQNVTM